MNRAPSSAGQQLRAQHTGLRLLLVEDNPVNRIIVLAQLQQVGLFADVACDGLEAIEIAATQHYPLILMDLHLPKLDGVAAAQHIRTLKGYEETPILAMTADAYEEDRQRCLAAGMNAHLVKPLLTEQLYEALLQWL